MDIDSTVAAGKPPSGAVVPGNPGEMRAAELRSRLAKYRRELTAKERIFAESYVRGGNVSDAYRNVYDSQGKRTRAQYTAAWRLVSDPDVAAYITELRAMAAHAAIVDVTEILAMDLAIVRAAEYADELSHHVYDSCRRCHGVDHKHQWKDEAEYSDALAQWMDDCADRDRLQKPHTAMPNDEGGYGFDARVEPSVTCPHCEGRGVERTIIGDTTKLTNSKPLYKGMKVTKNGIEVLMHDVDKAKERLLRAAGAFGDDAASVARGAAAGAAAGAAVANAVAAKAKDMTVDEVRKAYLGLVS